MATRKFTQVAYGLSQPLINENPQFIYAKRAPTTSDFAIPSTIWINSLANTVYILATVANNSATWVQVQAGGGAGVFSSLTVTPGPISLTGTTTINTAGAATTTIGTGGTGAVNIGNATGNTSVTGSLTASTGLVATTGGVTASAGNIVATLGNINLGAAAAVFTFGNGIQIHAGTGDPNGVVTAPEGSLYLNTNGTGTGDRMFVNTNSGTVWTGVTTAL